MLVEDDGVSDQPFKVRCARCRCSGDEVIADFTGSDAPGARPDELHVRRRRLSGLQRALLRHRSAVADSPQLRLLPRRAGDRARRHAS